EGRSARWSGFIEIPRTGKYLFELESDDGSRIFINNIKLVDNWGAHPKSRRRATQTLAEGVYPIRIEYMNESGGGSLAVRWRLPSGYNSVTSLPSAMLSPVRPWAADTVDRALRHAVWVLLLMALMLLRWPSVASWAASIRSDPRTRRRLAAALAIFALAVSVRVLDAGAQGETCDEWAYVGAGEIYAENLAGGSFRAADWKINREHPAVGKLFYAALASVFGSGPEVARVGAGVLNALTVMIAFLIALRLGGLGVAVGAGLTLSLLPPVLAHANIGTLDTPLTFFYTLTMGFFLRALTDRKRRTSALFWAALFAGLAIGVKFSAGLLLPFVLVTWLLWHLREIRKTGQVPMPWTLYIAPVVVLLPVVLTWPWLWSDTLAHLIDTLGHWKKIPGPEVFMGKLTRLRPRYYFVAWFAAATPALVLVFGAIGIGVALIRRKKPWLFVLGWLALPFFWSFVSLKQGGYRYVYPAFIPLGILVGLGLNRVAELISTRAIVPLLAGLLIYLGATVASSRPYHHYYFNEWVGGAGVVYEKRLFQIGFWGEGQHEAIKFLNENSEIKDSWAFEGNVNHTLLGVREDLVRRTGKNGRIRATWLIRDSLQPETERVPGFELAHMVRTNGAPLVGVYRRRMVDTQPSTTIKPSGLTRQNAAPVRRIRQSVEKKSNE
ncbi:MAG: 4-amino-4-deoxy-L-arabinose transferase-like glycosyltransferase, partial [Myxococcota bacterium]